MCADVSAELPINVIEGKYYNDYDVLAIIGMGSFAKVYKVQQKSDKTIHAIKILTEKISVDNNEPYNKEYLVLSKTRSKYVVEFRDAWIEGQKVYIQTEFCNHNLREIIDAKRQLFSNSDNQINPDHSDPRSRYVLALIDYFISVEIFEELVQSLQYLHDLDIIHRDLKPENILLLDSVAAGGQHFVKICDFGYAKNHHFSGQSHTRDKGTITYMAPEIVGSKYYDLKSDIYSLGLICGEMFGVNAYSFETSIRDKPLIEKYRRLETPIQQMLTEPVFRLRPTCDEVLKSTINWRLNINEMQTIQEFSDIIESLKNYPKIFFYNFLNHKLTAQLKDGAQDVPYLDTGLEDRTTPVKEVLGRKPSVRNAREGQIIQMTDSSPNGKTIWALYLGEDYIMYVCPQTHRLLRDRLARVAHLRECCVNNFEESAVKRQLSVRSVDTILADALRTFNKYEDIDRQMVDTKHDNRIHFVTKCRFGRQFCQECSGSNEVHIF